MCLKRLLLLLLLAAFTACSPVYVLRAGYEEAKILARRKPIERLVADPRTPATTRDKLALVLEAREFAAETLDLKTGESYTTFSQLDSDTLALVLSAARKDRFEAHTWWFPIIGDVPYKGFFRESKARREAAKLERKGFDTHLRPTSAFSTLGWFNDPLVSSLLRYDSVALANTVIHELFHNTFYAAGQAMFNESLANFAGGRGAIEFFCRHEQGNSPQCRQAQDEWHDDLVFGRFLSTLVAELEALYARDGLAHEQKLAAREVVFARARRTFAEEVRPQLRASSFTGFDRGPINNATLISRRLYYGRLDLFEQIFQRHGRNLDQTLKMIVQTARGARDPYAAVQMLAG